MKHIIGISCIQIINITQISGNVYYYCDFKMFYV